MTRRKRKSLSPSLFPFLAVLVCTLGTLILMLALVASNATASARQQADAAAEAIVEAQSSHIVTQAMAETLLTEAEFNVKEFVRQRDAQTAEIEKRREERAHLEDHIERLRAELDRISREADQTVAGNAAIGTLDQTLLDELAAQIEEERRLIEQAQQTQAGRPPRVVIVPHRGRNGTERRPIYLECRPHAVVIQPEGVEVSLEQLAASDPGANPLDDALRTARQHWMKVHGDTEPPYPLLVVRPNGILTYRLATAVLADWDDQYGYELVPSEVELAFPNPDPTLHSKMETVIGRAVRMQRRSIAVGGGSGTQSAGDASDADRSSFAHDRYSASGRGGGPHVISAADLARNNRRNGFRVSRNDRRHSTAAGSTEPFPRRQSGRPGERSFANASQNGEAPLLDAPAEIDPDMLAFLESSPGQSETRSNSLEPAGSADLGFGDAELASGGTTATQEVAGTNFSNLAGGTGGTQSSGGSTAPHSPTESPKKGGDSDRAPPPQGQSHAAQPPPTDSVRPGRPGWGLPDSLVRAHGNAVIRTIRISVHPNRIVLMPSGSRGTAKVFGLVGNDVTGGGLRLATAIRDRIESWGPATGGGRWQPRVAVEVAAGADARFEQLQRLFRDSGYEVIRR